MTWPSSKEMRLGCNPHSRNTSNALEQLCRVPPAQHLLWFWGKKPHEATACWWDCGTYLQVLLGRKSPSDDWWSWDFLHKLHPCGTAYTWPWDPICTLLAPLRVVLKFHCLIERRCVGVVSGGLPELRVQAEVKLCQVHSAPIFLPAGPDFSLISPRISSDGSHQAGRGLHTTALWFMSGE